nr:DinB family protein [uncultured Flavobacterium sp.]
METEFKITRRTHELLDGYFENFSIEDLNKIPDGFRNNLIWNIGHIIVSQQSLIYKGSGLPMLVSDELVSLYARGTAPHRDISPSEAVELRNLLDSLVRKTEDDYNDGVFTEYHSRKSEMGYDLSTVEDAIAFNNHHESLHLGIMMQLKKFI